MFSCTNHLFSSVKDHGILATATETGLLVTGTGTLELQLNIFMLCIDLNRSVFKIFILFLGWGFLLTCAHYVVTP